MPKTRFAYELNYRIAVKCRKEIKVALCFPQIISYMQPVILNSSRILLLLSQSSVQMAVVMTLLNFFFMVANATWFEFETLKN